MSLKLIHELFQEQINNQPDVPAICEEHRRFTYRELGSLVNTTTRILQLAGVKQDIIVGSLLPVSAHMAVSMLSVFQSGGIYLPLSFDFSQKRFEEIFKNTFSGILITSKEWSHRAKQLLNEHGVEIDYLVLLSYSGITIEQRVNGQYSDMDVEEVVHSKNSMDIAIDPEEGNYIFYTSGSTGEGKPILGSHKSLSHYIQWAIRTFEAPHICRRIAHLSTATFDASLKDALVPLCSGGTLYIPDADTKNNIVQLLKWIDTNQIQLFQTVPSLFRLMLKGLVQANFIKPFFNNLDYIVLDGEVLYAKDLIEWKRLVDSKTRLVNMYGTTETTILDTYHIIERIPEYPNQVIHVGKPIDDTFIIIANNGKLCKIGEVGEVYVKSPYQTRGYYKRDDLNEIAFVQNPVYQAEIDLVYKTGDRGRYLADRNIEILGRADNQVKINGVRIELNEIQQAVLAVPGIQESVSSITQGPDGQNEIVCYYVSENIDASELRNKLKKLLNAPAIPAYIIRLHELPLNNNGKVDKSKLPPPSELMASEDYAAPLNETEKKLEVLLAKILGRDKVSRLASFFDIGGQSLKAMQLIAHIHEEFQVNVKMGDVFANPTIGEMSRLIENAESSRFNKIAKIAKQEHYPVSFAQKRLWLIDQLGNNQLAYNLSGANYFIGQLNVEIFKKSVVTIIKRHEILRTSFFSLDGEPRQKITETVELDTCFRYFDWRSEMDKEEKCRQVLTLNSGCKFNLGNGPLMRLQLIHVDDDRYLFAYTLHHIISDGWSMNIIVTELLEIYHALSKNLELTLKELPVQYKDYATWNLAEIKSDKMQQHKSWWLSRFNDDIPRIDFPFDYPRPALMTANGNSVDITMEGDLAAKIRSFSNENGNSVFITLLAAVKALLYRYTGQHDLVIGVPTAGREHRDLQDQIGFYVNMLPVRTRLLAKESFAGLLDRVRHSMLEALEHQSYPFDLLVEELSRKRDLSRGPLFDIVVQYLNFWTGAVADHGNDFVITPLKTEVLNAQFDMAFNFIETGKGEIEVVLIYNSDLISRKKMERLLVHLKCLLQFVIGAPHTLLDNVDYLTREETFQLLKDFNHNESFYPKNKSIIALFEEQVIKTPGHIALECKEKRLSYTTVNETANRLARYIQKKFCVKPDDLVGVKLERSEWMIMAILGILKSGAAYVPIDPDYPEERIQYLLEDSRCKGLIDEHEITLFHEQQNEYETHNPAIQIDPARLLYVIYTSGSTGRPKGAMITHGSFVNLIIWYQQVLALSEHDNVLLIAPVSFDLAQKNIFTPLLFGAKLCIPEKLYGDYYSLVETISTKQVTIINCAPTAFYPFLDVTINAHYRKLQTLRKIVLGGEPINKEELLPWVKSAFYRGEVINSYGPTECTDVVSYYRIPNDEWESLKTIPIGMPVNNTRIYVLDQNYQLMPVGCKGEIFIAGDGVGRGYFNRPELTKQQFMADPFLPGSTMYRTGDVGKWSDNGTLEYMGRNDDQLKIRGYRIELSEIENVLRQYAPIEEVVVQARFNRSREKVLVAYVVSKENVSFTELRSYLSRLLPVYMIPAYFVLLDQLPLTPSGKTDKLALPDPADITNSNQLEYKLPETEDEIRLLEIWKDILERQDIGVEENFFEIGGHSLNASRVVARINNEYKLQLSLRSVFDHPTVQELAWCISKLIAPGEDIIAPVKKQEHYPASHAQKRIWLQSQFDELSRAYNLSTAISIKGDFNPGCFEQAVKLLFNRHESLRTRFCMISGEISQVIVDMEDIRFYLPASVLPAREKTVDHINKILAEESGLLFNPEEAPLIRVKLLEVSEKEFIVVITIHHIISDGWSLEIIARDLVMFYDALVKGREPLSAPLKIQYKDYAAWQMGPSYQEKLLSAASYWHNKFQGVLPQFEFPFDYNRPSVKAFKGAQFTFQLNESLCETIEGFISATGITQFVFWQGIIHLTLFKYNSRPEMILGCPVAGRNHIDLEDQVGCFLNILPLRLHLDNDNPFIYYLKQIRENTLEAFRYQSYPIDLLIEYLQLNDRSRNPLFDVGLTLHNQMGLFKSFTSYTSESFTCNFVEIPVTSSKTDLWFNVFRVEKNTSFLIEYDTALFRSGSIKHLSETIELTIEEAIRNPENTIEEILEQVKLRSAISYGEKKEAIKRKNITHLLKDKK